MLSRLEDSQHPPGEQRGASGGGAFGATVLGHSRWRTRTALEGMSARVCGGGGAIHIIPTTTSSFPLYAVGMRCGLFLLQFKTARGGGAPRDMGGSVGMRLQLQRAPSPSWLAPGVSPSPVAAGTAHRTSLWRLPRLEPGRAGCRSSGPEQDKRPSFTSS